MSEQNKAPRWEDVPEAGKAFVRLRLRDAHDEVGPMDSAYDLVREATDAALARLAEPATAVEPATCDRPDWSRGVVETAERLHGSVTGSGDGIDEDEAATWIDARTSPDGWQPSSARHNGGACAAYDEAVRALGRAAVAVARESGAWRPASREPAPAHPTAAERWRTVPEHAREAMIAELETSAAELDTAFGVNSAGKPWADHAAATRALLALAREADGGR